MTTPPPPAKCPTCGRSTDTHRQGCSHVDCPNRRPAPWIPDHVEGVGGRGDHSGCYRITPTTKD